MAKIQSTSPNTNSNLRSAEEGQRFSILPLSITRQSPVRD
jgi:hypothetical protein